MTEPLTPQPEPDVDPAADMDPTPDAALAPEAELGDDLGADLAVDEEEESRRRRKLLLLLLLLLAFIILMGLAIWYLLFRQPVPLPGIPGEVVMPTYSTSIYRPDRPMGVAVTEDGGRIYASETEGERIARFYDASGTELGLMQPPVSTGSEHVPVYVARDPVTGEVYVTDRPNGAIYIYDANGTYQRSFNPGVALEGWQPLGIAFDRDGNLYVTDVSTQPQQILVFDRAGNVVQRLGREAGLNFPNGIAVDKDRNVYVADSSNGRLLVLDTTGAVVAQVGRGVGEGNLGLPRGVTLDDKGRVYVADATGQGVFVYGTYVPGETALPYLGFFGGEGVGNGAFLYPNGITVDGRGRVYVTDAGNDRVQVWSY